MLVLCFDYGDAHIGAAIGATETGLAEPLITISHSDKLWSEISKLLAKYCPDKIIVGVSESASAVKASEFANTLTKKFPVEVELMDETLSSQDAVKSLGHVSAKKRCQLQHAAAAAVILESWLDEHCQDKV